MSLDDLLVPETCMHGGVAGLRADGLARCAICRRELAEAAIRAQEAAARQARFSRMTDYPALAANDDTLFDR